MRQRESDQPSSSSLAGVAPFDKQSGKSDPKRTTRGGRTGARTAGYMGGAFRAVLQPIIKAFVALAPVPCRPPSRPQDALDDLRVGDERHDAHLVVTLGTQQPIDLPDLLDKGA